MDSTARISIPLTADYTRRQLAMAVPGAIWDADEKTWVLHDPTPRAAAVALRIFPELGLDYPVLAELRDQLAQDVRPFDNATPAGLRVTDRLSERFAQNLESL